MQEGQKTEQGATLWLIFATEAVITGISMYAAIYLSCLHASAAVSVSLWRLPVVVAILCYFLTTAIFCPAIVADEKRGDLIVQRAVRSCVLLAHLTAFSLLFMGCFRISVWTMVTMGIIASVLISIERLTLRHMLSRMLRTHMEQLEARGEAVAPVAEPIRHPVCRIVKRMVDLVISISFLLTIFPVVYLVVAIITKCRKSGAIFNIEEHSDLSSETYTYFTFHKDIISNTTIHRMPMMLNVLGGGMSVVGPKSKTRGIKPGICSLTSESDIWYRQNWNFWLDLEIMIFSK